MAILQDHQRSKFIDANQLLGLSSDELTFTMSHPAFQNQEVVFAGDTGNGDIQGKLITLNSADELFNLTGLPASEKKALDSFSPFNGKVVVFAAEDLYVKSGQVVILGRSGEKELYNFGSITVEEGGQIRVEGESIVNCQLLTQL